jgi:hypothetical protein
MKDLKGLMNLTVLDDPTDRIDIFNISEGVAIQNEKVSPLARLHGAQLVAELDPLS